jgi:hypothetical protein
MGPIATDNELFHKHLVKQCYYKMKYKFIKPFIC